MLITEHIEKELLLIEVAMLPETKVRMEAAYYELLDDVLLKVPSAYADSYFPIPKMEKATYHAVIDGVAIPAITSMFSLKADFDELMNYADDVNINNIYATFKKTWKRRDILVETMIKVSAPITEEYLQTMRDLGKVKIEEPMNYSPSPREVVFCPTNNNNDMPF